MRGVITRPSAGLNAYTPSINITDNHLSDVLDATSLKEEALLMDVEQTLGNGEFHDDTDRNAQIKEVIAIQGTENYVSLAQNTKDYTWSIKHLLPNTNSVVDYPLSDSFLPANSLVLDGHFTDETLLNKGTGYLNSQTCTAKYEEQSCKFTATAQYGGIYHNFTLTAGQKIYIHIQCPILGFESVKLTWDLNTTNIVNAPSGIYQYVFTASANTTLKVLLQDARASAWTETTINYFTVIDVTHETLLTDDQIKTKYLAYGFIDTFEVGSSTYSSCNYSTSADKYVVFSCSSSPYLYYFEHIDLIVGKIALPFFPKKIVSHVNRIFAIDINNILWWCRAGDIYSWYGIEYDDNYLMASANMSLTSYTLTAQPDVARPITATTTTVSTADTLGVLNVVGLGVLGQSQTETLVPVANARVQTLLSYISITSITSVGWVAGGTADTIQFGVAPVSSGYVQSDNGYWTLERESKLTQLCVLSNNIFIFGLDNIYVFRGYSPDTFSMSQAVADIGIKDNVTPRKWLTTINNLAYFYMNGDIYEFNGYDYPRLISHPVYVNGQNSNSILGGVNNFSTNYALASDNDRLYVYDATTALFDTNYYYEFNTKTRSWWRKSGFSKHNSIYDTNEFNVIYVTTADTDGIVAFVNDGIADTFDMHYELGHKGLLNPYITTKAYNTSPSELGTLTHIVLQILGRVAEPADIIFYYSLSANSTTDFIEFRRMDNYVFNGDIENIHIPVPVSCVANAHHYRLKIEINGYAEVYNIERRFRVRGMTR